MVLLQFSMTPLDKGESVSAYVARSVDIIDRSGLDYEVHAMGTILEGELDAVLAVVKACHDRMSEDCARISTSIKIDHRRGRSGRLRGKVRSVEERLGREVRRGTDRDIGSTPASRSPDCERATTTERTKGEKAG